MTATFVLRKKAGIYAWLLVGFIPIWTYALTERLAGPKPILEGLFPLAAGVPLIVSLWIVIRRYEAVEQQKMPKRVWVLLWLLSVLLGLSVVAGVLMSRVQDII